jgi:hypothetical protein
MFYSAVGRPRFDNKGRCYLDGKIGERIKMPKRGGELGFSKN